MAIGQSNKTRQERLLQSTKGFRPTTGIGVPRQSEGNTGDIKLNSTPNGIRLFIKFNNQWISFKPEDNIVISDNKIERSIKTDTEEINLSGSWANIDTTDYALTLPHPGSYLVYGTFLTRHDGVADAWGKIRLWNNTTGVAISNTERKIIDISASVGGVVEISTSYLWKLTIPSFSVIYLQGYGNNGSKVSILTETGSDSEDKSYSEFGYIKCNESVVDIGSLGGESEPI